MKIHCLFLHEYVSHGMQKQMIHIDENILWREIHYIHYIHYGENILWDFHDKVRSNFRPRFRNTFSATKFFFRCGGLEDNNLNMIHWRLSSLDDVFFLFFRDGTETFIFGFLSQIIKSSWEASYEDVKQKLGMFAEFSSVHNFPHPMYFGIGQKWKNPYENGGKSKQIHNTGYNFCL